MRRGSGAVLLLVALAASAAHAQQWQIVFDSQVGE